MTVGLRESSLVMVVAVVAQVGVLLVQVEVPLV